MTTRLAYIKPTLISESGIVVDKNNPTTTLQQVMTSETQMRIVPDVLIPNSAGAPTIGEYIELERIDGLDVLSLTNTTIVTQD